jgi:anti-anti-sigma factor
MTQYPPLRPGFSRADLHVHTTYSDGTATPEDVLNYYGVHSDIRVMAITDHDTIDGALHARRFAAQHPDLFGHLEVIVGEEISSRDGHILGLFLRDWVAPGMDAGRTVDVIHAQGGIAVAAHPYTSWMRWSGLVGVGDLIRAVPFDAVETRNSNFTEVFANRKAERRAGSKARVGNSDGHFLDAIGRCYTEFPGSSAADLRRALLERETVAAGGCYGAITLLRFVLGRLRAHSWVFPRRRDLRREAAAGELEIKVHEESGLDAVILAPVGRLDDSTMPELKQTVALLAEARVAMVLDMSGVSSIEPAGVTALVAGMKIARKHGVGFCLASLSSACARALDAARLLKVLPQARSVRAARRRVMTGPLTIASADAGAR